MKDADGKRASFLDPASDQGPSDGWEFYRRTVRAIRCSTRTATERHVLRAILDHADNETGEAFPGMPAIAEATGLSLRAVEQAIKALRVAGWLACEPSASRWGSNVYRITPVESELREPAPRRAGRPPVSAKPPGTGPVGYPKPPERAAGGNGLSTEPGAGHYGKPPEPGAVDFPNPTEPGTETPRTSFGNPPNQVRANYSENYSERTTRRSTHAREGASTREGQPGEAPPVTSAKEPGDAPRTPEAGKGSDPWGLTADGDADAPIAPPTETRVPAEEQAAPIAPSTSTGPSAVAEGLTVSQRLLAIERLRDEVVRRPGKVTKARTILDVLELGKAPNPATVAAVLSMFPDLQRPAPGHPPRPVAPEEQAPPSTPKQASTAPPTAPALLIDLVNVAAELAAEEQARGAPGIGTSTTARLATGRPLTPSQRAALARIGAERLAARATPSRIARPAISLQPPAKPGEHTWISPREELF